MRRSLKKSEPPVKARRSMKRREPEPEPPRRSLKRKAVAPAKPKTGPIPRVPEGFVWLGDEDARYPDHMHVKPEDMPEDFPSPFAKVLPGTVFRVHQDTGAVDSMVTVLPGGLHMAWASCTQCLNAVTRCICQRGFVHPRGVEWAYIRALLRVDGVDLPSNPNIDHHEVTQRAVHHYVSKSGGSVTMPPVKPRAKSSGITQPPTPSNAPRRSLRRRGDATPAPAEYDMKQTDKDAASEADVLTRRLSRRLSRKG